MEKDIVVRIDELIGFFIQPGSMASQESPEIQSELSMLFSKVMSTVKDIQGLSGSNKKKAMKKAVEVVIRKESLNKSWAKKLKQYVKKYS